MATQPVTAEEYQKLVEIDMTADFSEEEPCESCGEIGINCPEWRRVTLMQIRGGVIPRCPADHRDRG